MYNEWEYFFFHLQFWPTSEQPFVGVNNWKKMTCNVSCQVLNERCIGVICRSLKGWLLSKSLKRDACLWATCDSVAFLSNFLWTCIKKFFLILFLQSSHHSSSSTSTLTVDHQGTALLQARSILLHTHSSVSEMQRSGNFLERRTPVNRNPGCGDRKVRERKKSVDFEVILQFIFHVSLEASRCFKWGWLCGGLSVIIVFCHRYDEPDDVMMLCYGCYDVMFVCAQRNL